MTTQVKTEDPPEVLQHNSKNGTPANLTPQELQIFQDLLNFTLVTNGIAEQRRNWLANLGKQFLGERDIYKVVGYKVDPDFNDFMGRYMRDGIAARIVDAPVSETWRNRPTVTDGDPDSQFSKAWAVLADTKVVTDDIDDLDNTSTLWHYIETADKIAGVGRFGGLLVGINDGLTLDQPLGKSGSRPDGLLYLTPLDEDHLDVKTVVKDMGNKRAGFPEIYTAMIGQQAGVAVHWSRVVHIAENRGSDPVYGKSRLLRAFNLLEDLFKITAGSGESAWKLIYKGIVLTMRDGYTLPDDDGALREKLKAYADGLDRFLDVEGADVHLQGGEIVDPSGVIKIIVALIAATVGMPQRILLGSERGELASSQDEVNWRNRIQTRQNNFAAPMILRPLINRFIYSGILPRPTNNTVIIDWPDITQPTLQEQVEINSKRATIIKDLAPPGGIDRVITEGEIRDLALLEEIDMIDDPIAKALDTEDDDATPEDDGIVEEMLEKLDAALAEATGAPQEDDGGEDASDQ